MVLPVVKPLSNAPTAHPQPIRVLRFTCGACGLVRRTSGGCTACRTR